MAILSKSGPANSGSAVPPGADAAGVKGGSVFALIPDTPADDKKLGPDGKPLNDKEGKNKVTAMKTEGIKPASALGLIAFVLILALGVGLWFVSKIAAIIVLMALAALVLVWLLCRALFRAMIKRKSKQKQPQKESTSRQTRTRRSLLGQRRDGGSWGRRHNGDRSHRAHNSAGGHNGSRNHGRRNPFRHEDGSRRNPFKRSDGSKRSPFRRQDGSRRNPWKRNRDGTRRSERDQRNHNNPHKRSRDNAHSRTRGGPFRRADGSSRFRRRPANSHDSEGGRKRRRNSQGSQDHGGRTKRRGRDKSGGHGNNGGKNNPHTPTHSGACWYKPWSWKRRRRDEERDTHDNNSLGARRSRRWTDQANQDHHYDPDGWQSHSNPKNGKRRRWYHGPGWGRQTYAGFSTDGDGHQGYHEFRPGDRWEQFRERWFGNGPVKAHATRMPGSVTNPQPATPTTATDANGNYAPVSEPSALRPSAQAVTHGTGLDIVHNRGGTTMSGDRAVAGSAIGARSAQVNLQAADGTMESAVLHLINAARNDVTGMNYIESGDPKLIPVGEMLRQLAAEQYATADNRAQLTAAHHAIAAKDAQEG